jgi:outer membrane beta-barrel protein
MRRILTGLTALAVLAFPLPTLASPPDDAPPEEGDEEEELILDDEDMEAVPDQPAEGTPSDTSFLDGGGGSDDGAGPEIGGTTGEVGAASEGAPSLSEDEQRKIDEKEITVIQPQAFLNVYTDAATGKKKRRIELMPQVGLTINDPFVRHWAVGAEVNYWLTNRMAIGINGTAFFGARTSQYDRIRFQEGLLLTANKTLWQGSVDYLYEPFYGKIALFNRLLLHWETYVQIGGGAIHTQNIPRFQAIHPTPYNHITGQVNVAAGVRYYIQNLDWFSVNFGVRTFGFFDAYEPQNRGVGNTGDDPRLDDPKAAYAAAKEVPLGERLAFNVLFFVGASFYLPPKFDYSYRR